MLRFVFVYDARFADALYMNDKFFGPTLVRKAIEVHFLRNISFDVKWELSVVRLVDLAHQKINDAWFHTITSASM